MTRYAVGLPNVGQFADPHRLVGLAVAAEEHGWDGFFIWDHVLYHNPEWSAVNPVVVVSAIAARTSRVRLGACRWWRGDVRAARDRIEAGPPR